MSGSLLPPAGQLVYYPHRHYFFASPQFVPLIRDLKVKISFLTSDNLFKKLTEEQHVFRVFKDFLMVGVWTKQTNKKDTFCHHYCFFQICKKLTNKAQL